MDNNQSVVVKSRSEALVVITITTMILLLLLLSLSIYIMTTLSKAYSEDHDDVVSSTKITTQTPFTGSDNTLNVIGTIRNDGNIPLKVKLGLDVMHKGSGLVTTIEESPYSNIVYPSAISPFKFSVKPGDQYIIISSNPSIIEAEKVSIPHYDKVLVLNYSNSPVGRDAALIGTVKNIGSFNLYNVSIYASVHNENGTHIDSVKSKAIPVIKAGQEIPFTAVPDSAIKSQVKVFSCAGIELHPKMNTIDIGKGQVIAYDLEGVGSISSYRYDNATKSIIIFGVKSYNPAGGPMSLKMVKNNWANGTNDVSVIMDGKPDKKVSIVKLDGKTVNVNFFVPPPETGMHQVQIRGIVSPLP